MSLLAPVQAERMADRGFTGRSLRLATSHARDRREAMPDLVTSAQERLHAVDATGRHSRASGSCECSTIKCQARCAEYCEHATQTSEHSPVSGPCRRSDLALALQNHASSLSVKQYPGPFDQQSNDTAKWWFYCPEQRSQLWDVAKHHWGIAAWDIARTSNLFYNCLELYAWRKRAHLTSQVERYVRQQTVLIRKIGAQIQTQGSGRHFEPLTLVAIGILAYVSLLDSNLDAAGVHLHAIKRLDPFKHFEKFQHEWLYVIWVDLRYALLLRIPPVLAYFVPLAFRVGPQEAGGESQLSARKSASRNSALSPHSRDFDKVESYSLFLKLHRLYGEYASSRFAENPPYGLIYDLEYRLRTLGAQEHQADDQGMITSVDCVELLLVVVQLHVWILCRYCAPVSSYTRRHVLLQALQLLGKAPAPVLVAKWQSIADMSSLLWVLATLTACSLEVPIDNDATISTAFQYALGASKTLTFDEISSEMRQWPWDDEWHSRKIRAVWEAIGAHRPITRHASSLLSPSSNWCFYVGAVEFYSSEEDSRARKPQVEP